MSAFMPHGYCIFWNPTLLTLHVASDFIIFLSYFSIPAAIFYYLRKKSLKLRAIPILFILFIISCGLTHLYTIWNWWHADYWQSGTLKLICALISMITAIALWILMPKLLKIPTADELKALNEDLEKSVRKRTLDLELANRRLEKVSQNKSDFLASVSHEIRNHLHVIGGSSEALGLSRVNPEQFNEMIQMIQRNSQTLNKILNDTLDLSKIERGTLHIEESNFSVSELIKELKFSLSTKAQEKNIDLTFDIDSNLPQFLISDEIRLLQVLSNLITNAIKYTKKGGQVLIKATSQISKKDNIANVEFTVSDSGVGIPREDHDKIFQSFSRSKVHSKIEGVGIGLSLSKDLAQLLGGDIELIESSSNGSTFKFEFKCQLGSQIGNTSIKEITSSTPDWKNKHILIVDDAKENRVIYKAFLSQTNIQIDEAASGEDALKLYEDHKYEVILLDIEMPGLSGPETLRKIKEQNPYQLVLALTALSSQEFKYSLIAQGFDGIASKPIAISSLISLLQETFEKVKKA